LTEELPAMIPSWFRLWSANRFKTLCRQRTARRPRRPSLRLEIETLEGRVLPANLVTITLASDPTQPTFGQPVTFTTTVPSAGAPGTPSGTVKFFVEGTQRGPAGGVTLNPTTHQASIAVPADVSYVQFQGGSHTITASYSGDASFDPASATLNETVARAVTTTTVNGQPNPSNVGQAVTITATVTGTTPAGPVDPTAPKPTGLVDFFDTTTNTDLGSAPVDATGHAPLTTSSLAGGQHAIRADYLGQASPVGPGDQNYTPTSATNGSGVFTQIVNPGSTSTAVTTDHPSGSV